jgi:hypothetical protein
MRRGVCTSCSFLLLMYSHTFLLAACSVIFAAPTISANFSLGVSGVPLGGPAFGFGGGDAARRSACLRLRSASAFSYALAIRLSLYRSVVVFELLQTHSTAAWRMILSRVGHSMTPSR